MSTLSSVKTLLILSLIQVRLEKLVFLCFLLKLVIIDTMVYVILVLVLVPFLMSFIGKLCMKLVLVNLRTLMSLFTLLIETVCPIGIVRDVEVLCGNIKYPADFLVLGSEASKTCPIIFGRSFLNTCGAIIDCKKDKVLTKFDGYSYEFKFSKFAKAPYDNNLPNEDFRVEQ